MVTRVVDGDTVDVQLSSGPIRVRLHAIDAPETRPRQQPWGPEATEALRQWIEGQQVSLEPIEQDRYDRLVAVIYLGDDNVNAGLVWGGFAWADRRYGRDPAYCQWEGEARRERRGLWSTTAELVAPWDWRAWTRGETETVTQYSGETVENCIAALGQRGASPSRAAQSVAAPVEPQAQQGNCRIKGNISENGRIYHVPGSPAYDRTKIDPSKGERWFCSEAEARAAGWRPPK